MFRLKTKITVVFTALILGLVFLRSFAFATVNEQISFQGKLADSTGVAVADGNYNIVFNLYTVSTGGTTVWTGTHTTANGNAVAVEDGIFAIMLGSGTGNSLSGINFNQTLYLGITVGADSEMTPRKVIGAVPQSIVSKYLETASGSGAAAGTGADDVLLLDGSGNINISGDVLGASATFTGNLTVDTNTLYVNSANHRVGIGTTNPGAKLNIDGDVLIGGTTAPFSGLYSLSVVSSDAAATYIVDLATSSLSGRAFAIGATGESYVRTLFYSNSFLGFGPGNATRDTFIGRSSANTLRIGSNYDGSGTGNLIVNGNVGIGTTGPSSLLHIYDNDNTTTIGQKPNALILEQYNADFAGVGSEIQFQGRGSSRTTKTFAAITGYVGGSALGTGTYGDIIFSTKQAQVDTSLTERVTIKNSGNVGIGTTAPGAKLHVQGNDVWITTSDFVTGSVGSSLAMGPSTRTGDTYLEIAALKTGASVWSDLVLQRNGGNVGIGTTGPNERLDVNGTNPRIYLGDASAPGTTTNRLYSVSGSLYWDGTQLGAGGSSLWTDGGTISYLTATADDIAMGGSTSTSPFYLDVSANSLRLGSGSTANAVLNMYASDGDTGSLTYTTNDAWAFEGGNVGIGMTNPEAKLHISGGKLRVDSTTASIFSNDASSSTYLFIEPVNISDTSGHVRLGAYDMNGSTGWRDLALNDGGGNVGIGTTGPGYKLEVDGDIAAVGSGSKTLWIDSSNGSANIVLDRYATSNNAYINYREDGVSKWFMGFSGTHGNDWHIAEGSNARLLIEATSGNVGIGTTDPSEELEVYTATDTTDNWPLVLRNNVNNVGGNYDVGLKFKFSGDGGNEINKWVGIKAVAGTWGAWPELAFYTQPDYNSPPDEQMRIDKDGNVGIGTVSPEDSLSVGNINIGDNYGGGYQGVWLNGEISGANYNFLSSTGAAASLFINRPSGADIIFREANSATPQMHLDNGGNVGIGTTGPGSILDIHGNTNDTILGLRSQDNSVTTAGEATRVRFGTSSGAFLGDVGYMYQSASLYGIRLTSADNLNFFVNGSSTPSMVIKDSGNVGIGTTGPYHKLDVRGNAFIGTQNIMSFATQPDTIYLGAPRKFLSNTTGINVDGSTDWMNLLAHPGSKGIILGTSGTADATPHNAVNAHVVIQAAGNVGIGTTGPSSLLDIGGGVANHIDGTNDVLIADDLEVDGTIYGDGSGITGISTSPAGSDGQIQYNNSGVMGGTSGLYYDDINNRLGIGTTAPIEGLDIVGNIKLLTSTGIGKIYTNADSWSKTWTSNADFNASGTTFSSGMADPATDDELKLESSTSSTVDTSTTADASAHSFQRKTWYDGTRYWSAFQAGSAIEFWYSADGSTSWTQNTNATISVSTDDFSLDADSSNAFIAYTNGYDVQARTATSYPGTSFAWGTSGTAYDGSAPVSFGSEYNYNTSRVDYISVSNLDSTHFVVVYRDYNGGRYGKAVIGTVSGSTISYGSTYTYNDSYSYYNCVAGLDSTHFVVTFQDDSNNDYGTARIGTISGGNVISFGSKYVFNSGSTHSSGISVFDSTHFAISYRDYANSSYGTAIIATVSGGNTISYGSEYVFYSGPSYEIHASAFDTTSFVTIYRDGNDQGGKAVIGTRSGNVITYGSALEFSSNAATQKDVSTLDSTHFVIAYSSDSVGRTRVGTKSGNSISYGSEYTFNSSTTGFPSVINLDSTHFVVSYADGGNSNYGTSIIGTVSNGNVVGYGSEYIFNSNTTSNTDVCALDSTHFVPDYRDSGSSYRGSAAVGHYAGNNSYEYPSITRDSNSKVWLTSTHYSASNYLFKAIQSTNANDISAWQTASSLDTSTNSNKYGTIVPSGTGEVYASWIDGTAIEGKEYASSLWGSTDSIATGVSGMTKNMSAVSDSSNNVHLAYIDSSNHLVYRRYTTSWQTAVTLDSNTGNEYPTISLNTSNNNLFIFWIRANNIYYRQGASPYASANWQSAVTWEATTQGSYVNANYSNSSKTFAIWKDGGGSPYNVKFRFLASYSTSEQSWTSESRDAGSGNTYQPNELTVHWDLDGTDNTAPKIQVMGSATGSFSGEETIYPAGSSTYYQDGGTYDINNNESKDISSQVTSAYRYWKLKAYLDTGSDDSDTPKIYNANLQEDNPLLLQDQSGNVGIGTTSPDSKLQVTGGGLCVGSDANCNMDNNTEGVVYSSSVSMTVYDVAEMYPTKDTSLQPGEILVLDKNNGVFVERVSGRESDEVLGVVSEEPGVLLGGFAGTQFRDEHQIAVALAGRVPVFVSTENGSIAIGDPITSSNISGVGMKATKPGRVIGRALENYSGTGVDKIQVFVNTSWYESMDYLTKINQIISDYDGGLLGGGGSVIMIHSDLVVNSIQAQIGTFAQLSGETMNIGNGSFEVDALGNVITDGSITADKLFANSLEVRELRAKENESIGIVLGDSEGLTAFSVKDFEGRERARITSEGKLEFTEPATESDPDGSTGEGVIPAGEVEVVMENSLVKESTRIFISPITSTFGEVPYSIDVLEDCGFTVKIDNPVVQDIRFNYWVIN